MSGNIINLTKVKALQNRSRKNRKEQDTELMRSNRYRTAQAVSLCLGSLLKEAETAELSLASAVIRLAIDAITYDLAQSDDV
jgi:hypothetical protein